MTLPEARLQVMVRMLPAIQLFSLLDAVLLTWYFWDDVHPPFLLVWTGIVAVHGLVWWLYSRSPGPWQWMLVHAVVEGLLFGAFIAVVFPIIPQAKEVVLAAFVTGLLAAGALSKMSIPRAAHLFIATLTFCSALGFAWANLPSPWIIGLLLGGFAVALAVLVTAMSRVFDARVEAEQELGRQKALVSDLLDDFGQAASEGLWEVDPEGRLTYVSPRLAELFGEEPEVLKGRPLVPNAEWALTWTRPTPFRHLEVPVEAPTGRRWWALTGKPVRSAGRITGWRGVASDVTDHRKREVEVLRLSRYDNLTGLLNRASFRNLIDDLFDPGSDPALRCLVLLDVNNFKEVNEVRGHAFGDALLAAVAERLRTSVPERFVLARLDGDEFALQGEVIRSIEETLANLHRLLERLTEPYVVAGDRFEAGFSVGVSFTPNDATTPDHWLRCTDLALRASKAGHSPVEVYTPAMMESFLERSVLKEALKDAGQRGELGVVYQPIVGLVSGKVAGFEALVRWTHPTRGPIPPSVFVPLAEENETILGLGLWVLEQACRTALSWPSTLSISVNVSPVQMRSANLSHQVLEIVERVGLDPHRLILEVTESALVKDDGALIRTFTRLKERGVRWALDDFGTGYSSLSYLQDFPFDKLKIDQSFVRPITGRQPSQALLRAIVTIAGALGLTTTAEGIEDEAHRELLRSLGCEKGQGYLFSRPVPAEQALLLLGQQF